MNSKANAVLLMAKTKALQDKPNRYKTEMCDSHTNPQRVLTALPDAGRDDWARFKRECVLLKPTKRKSK
jgi:hypothetical protein